MNMIKYIFFAYILYSYIINDMAYNINNPKQKDHDRNFLGQKISILLISRCINVNNIVKLIKKLSFSDISI